MGKWKYISGHLGSVWETSTNEFVKHISVLIKKKKIW